MDAGTFIRLVFDFASYTIYDWMALLAVVMALISLIGGLLAFFADLWWR